MTLLSFVLRGAVCRARAIRDNLDNPDTPDATEGGYTKVRKLFWRCWCCGGCGGSGCFVMRGPGRNIWR